MRFYLDFELDKLELTKEYRRCILSFIKLAFSEYKKGEYKELYFHNTDTKDYTFTVFLKGAKFVGDKVFIESKKIRIRFSTDSKSETGSCLINSFLQQKNRKFPLPDTNSMILRKIQLEELDEITSPKVLFRTAVGGGLCIRNHDRESNKDKYYTFLDEEFLEQMKANLKGQAIKANFSEAVADNIILCPVQFKKVVVKHYNVLVDTTIGTFTMQANTDLMQYFYSVGIGSRKSSGFGMLDLITQECA